MSILSIIPTLQVLKAEAIRDRDRDRGQQGAARLIPKNLQSRDIGRNFGEACLLDKA